MLTLRLSRTWMMAIVFPVAMIYASACSASCAIGTCISLPAQSGDAGHQHHQDHDSPQSPGGEHKHGSDSDDCDSHGHPASFVRAPSAPQFGLSAQAWAGADDSIASLPNVWGLKTSVGPRRDHAPPQFPKEPLYKTISVLRI